MKILIRTLTNEIYDGISVNSNDTVKTIKDKIQVALGIPPYQQRLIFNGYLLNDENFISDYNITENSTINLVLKLRGGLSIKDNPIEEEKRSKEKEERINFLFKFEDKKFFFSYDKNWTIKEMLTNFLSKINSKETPEKLTIIYNSHLLNRLFSKKIKETFRNKKDPYVIKIINDYGLVG